MSHTYICALTELNLVTHLFSDNRKLFTQKLRYDWMMYGCPKLTQVNTYKSKSTFKMCWLSRLNAMRGERKYIRLHILSVLFTSVFLSRFRGFIIDIFESTGAKDQYNKKSLNSQLTPKKKRRKKIFKKVMYPFLRLFHILRPWCR